MSAFSNAVALENSGDIEDAMHNYRMVLDNLEDPRAAVNLGVIYFTRRDFSRAVELFQKATEIDPGYAIAFCNLGNALDELLMPKNAIHAYETAIRVDPRHADAHYNLALALDTKGEHRRAVKHWRAYVKLDMTGPHADHARRSIRRTVTADRLRIVRSA